MAYTIMINEYQRALITKALNKMPANAVSVEEGTGNQAYDTEEGELRCLERMFEELPREEAEQPGILHGFCL